MRAGRGSAVRIAEVVVAVGDVDAAADFYRTVCGFAVVRVVGEGAGRVAELDAGGQRVTLVARPAPGVVLALATPDAREEAARIGRLRGVRAEVGDPVQVEGGTWVPVADPWGNRIGLWQEHAPDQAETEPGAPGGSGS